MKPSTSLSLATEIAIILRAQIPQYPPGNRNAEAFDEASRIVVREEKMRLALEAAEADITRFIESSRAKSLGQIRADIRAAIEAKD